MISVFATYLIVLALCLPPVLKSRKKQSIIAFSVMFVLAFIYSLLSALNVPLDGVPFFFSNLLKDWGIGYSNIQ